MASTSNQAFLSDSELVDYLTTLESEEECSDDNYIFGESSDSDSDDIVTESVTVPSQSTPKRSRIEACAPLFQWTDNEYTPQIHDFDDTNAGITPGMFTDESTCLDYFKHFVSNDLVVKIVEETNNFYDYLTSKVAPSPSSRLQKWTHTDENEIYLFLAITMLMARNKKLSLKDYWSNDPLLECPQFKNLMTRDSPELLVQESKPRLAVTNGVVGPGQAVVLGRMGGERGGELDLLPSCTARCVQNIWVCVERAMAWVLLALAVGLGQVTGAHWSHSAELDPNYTVFWTPGQEDITFEVQVRTLGYVGFGFSEDGKMPGADLVVGWVKDGNVFFQVGLSSYLEFKF
ncbi:hypothetical protein C0J52_00767 [Blattella germanica]|nr:hypothetical protein C0J52_00767 [Blattella germanica]